MEIFENLYFILQDAIQLGLIWSLLALGIFISFRVLDFPDLTAEGTLTLGSAISTIFIFNDVNPVIATIMALLGGFMAGAITGILHTKLKIPAILAGIISMTGLFTINLRIMGRASLSILDKNTIFSYMRNIIDNSFLSKTITELVIVIILFLILYWFFGTEIGMSIRATGMNQKMSRSQGINTHTMIILGLALSNALIALCGALVAQHGRSANMDAGKGTLALGLASIIVGEVIFGKRSFKNWLISVILGSIVYQSLSAIAIQIGLDANDLKLIQAILIATIFSLPLIKKFYRNRYKEVKANA